MKVRDAIAKFAATRPMSWYFLHIANPIDRRLLPATNGRFSLAIGQRVLCLEVVGARSGKIRRTPLLYNERDGDLVVIASATGRPKDPAWYHNLRANPRVKIYAPRGRTGEYVARTAEGEERQQLWNQARSYYKGFDTYERRTTRHIPVVVLTRAQ